MQRQRIVTKIGLLVFAGAVLPMAAQAPHPTCNQCQATYIPKSELDAYTKRSIENKINKILDQEVRSVDIVKVNVEIGIVTRGKLQPGDSGGEKVAEHEQVSEMYHVIDGSATLLTGPDLVDAEQRPNTLKTVREQNGPGFNAKSIKNQVTHELKAGDVLIVPAGTGHSFTRIDDHITYLMVRIDPDKVVSLKSEAQSKAYLQSPVTK